MGRRGGQRWSRRDFVREVDEVARALIGATLRVGPVAVRLTEVEAYGGPEDSASHCRFGPTPRNAPMWAEGGLLYVYLCYGLHHLTNVVTGPRGRGQAVLLRSAEVLEGHEVVLARRGRPLDAGGIGLCGPGRLSQGLGLTRADDGRRFGARGRPADAGPILAVEAPREPVELRCGPRVGIDFASPADRRAPRRYAALDSPAVTHPRALTRP